MRPIELSFSGLHSYMEQQTVDFAALGAYGLFGIFGPTGAGKSTILDGITLALYGKIARAAGNLNGMIHLQCEKAWVSLTFSLGETVYVAERLLERDKKDREKTNTKQCRLYDKTHETVLADKAKQVDGMILSLLGIGMEDFCRAVVLPQGKFQEFLNLTGKDRGEMLENIFGLERYGDGLTAKILRARGKEEMALAELKGEVSAVSLYNQEDKESLAQALAEQQQKTKAYQEQQGKLETAYHLYGQLAKEAAELQETKAQLEQLNLQQPQMIEQQKLIQKLRILQTFAGSVEQVEDLTLQLEKKEADCQAKEIARNEALAEQEALQQQEGALTQWQEEQSRLQRLVGDLERLGPSLTEMATLAAEIEQRKSQMELCQEQMAKLEQEGKAQKQKIAACQEQSDQIEQEKKAYQAILAQRAFLQQIGDSRKKYDQEKKNAQKAEADVKANSEKIIGFCRQANVDLMLPQAGHWLTAETLLQCEETIRQFAMACKENLTRVKEGMEKAELQWRQTEEQYACQQLAQTLKENAPCPVCGSLSHPKIACYEKTSSAQRETAREKLAAAKQAYECCLQAQMDADRQEQQFSSLKETYETVYLAAYEAGQKECVSLEANLQKLEQQCRELLGLSFEEAWRQLQTADEGWLSQSQKQGELGKTIKDYQQALEASRESYRILQEKWQGMAAQNQAQKDQWQKQQQQLTACCNQWQIPLMKTVDGLVAFLTKTKQQEMATGRQIEEFTQKQTAQKEQYQTANQEYLTARALWEQQKKHRDNLKEKIEKEAVEKGVAAAGEPIWQQVMESMVLLSQLAQIENEAQAYEKEKLTLEQKQIMLQNSLEQGNYSEEQYRQIAAQYEEMKQAYQSSFEAEVSLQQKYEDCLETLAKQKQLGKAIKEREVALERLNRLQKLCQGKKLIKYLSQEYLVDMAYEASQLLDVLTNHRYQLEVVGKEGFKENFIMIDAYNGGQMRPVRSLSGGETFLVSLALALALSNKIQLKGKYPLDFFFLDEGFGTLDEEKLEVVLSVLEKLPMGNKMVGIITHVPELKSRLPRFLQVSPAVQGKSSQITMGMN